MHLIAACYTSSRPCPRSIRTSRHIPSCLCSHKIYRQRGQYKSTFAIWSSQLAASNKYGVLTPKRASLDASRLRVKWTRTTYMMHACNYGCFAGSGLRLARGASKGALQTRAFARFTQPILAAWTKRTVVEDHWFKEAKKHGYVSRAAYKLKEIQTKHKLIRPGARVLDLGCSPGAWLQVACQELGPRERGGLVLGVDIQEVAVPKRFCDDRVHVIHADARTLPPAMLAQYAPEGFDTVLSDMLHFTSGVNDVELSIELASTALHIATGFYYDKYGEPYTQQVGFKHAGYLRPGGALVMKVYEGSGTNEFVKEVQQYFTKVVRMRVEASRSQSREFFCVGLGRKQPK